MAHDPYRPPSSDVGTASADPDRIAVGDTLRLSGRAFARALPLVLGFGVLSSGVSLVPDLFLPDSVGPTDPTRSLSQVGLGLVVGMVLGPLTAGAYAWVTARVHAGQPAPIGAALRHAAGRYGRVFTTNLAYTLGVTVGTMACLVPGVALSVAMGPMLMSAALSPEGVSDWNRGWTVGKAQFWPLALAMAASWMPTMLISGGMGGAAGALAVTGQALPGWVAVVGGLAGAIGAPLVTTTLAAAWVLATEEGT